MAVGFSLKTLLFLVFLVLAVTVLLHRGQWDNTGQDTGIVLWKDTWAESAAKSSSHHGAAEAFQQRLRQGLQHGHAPVPKDRQHNEKNVSLSVPPQIHFVLPADLSPLEQAMLASDAAAGGENDLPEELKLSDAVHVSADELPTCGSLGLSPTTAKKPGRAPPRVFDTVMFNSEFSQAEIRFMTLANVVDYFVVVEANITYQGNPKPYYFDAMWERLDDALKAKIIRVKLEMTTDSGDKELGQWQYEVFMRQHGMVRMGAIEKGGAQTGDIILVSDMDEIPRPSLILLLKLDWCQVEYPITVQVALSHYSFRIIHDPTWRFPQIDRMGSSGTEHQCTAEELRSNKPPCASKTVVRKGGWSCSWCFKTIGRYLNKAQSFAHVELNTPKYSRPEYLAKHIYDAADLTDRPYVHNFVLPPGEPVDAPPYVLAHPDRFDYMIDHLQKPFIKVYASSLRKG